MKTRSIYSLLKIESADKEALKDMMMKLSGNDELLIDRMIMNAESKKNVVEYSLKELQSSTIQGASWNGTVRVLGGVTIVALAVFGYYYYAASQITE